MSILLQLSDEQLIALTAYGEAANQGSDGLMGVINVIVNRVNEARREFVDQNILNATGSLWKAVILKPYQFSIFNADIGLGKMQEIAANFSSYMGEGTPMQIAYNLAQMATAGMLADNTGGAEFYLNPKYSSQAGLSRMQNGYDLLQIRDHVFFSDLPAWQRKARQAISDITGSPVIAEVVTDPITYAIIGGIFLMTMLKLKDRRQGNEF